MSAAQAIAHEMDPKPTVFIVDDDAAVRAGLSLLVRSYGWEACPCASAEEFLASFRPAPGRCLLLDLQMPGMNGVELQAALAERGLELPVIVVTAHRDHPMAERALAAGARAVVGKPFRNDELVGLIRAALGE